MLSVPSVTGGTARLYRITLTGVVQGVGFRPFVKRLADRLGLCGEVGNTGAGLRIDIQSGDEAVLKTFLAALRAEAPGVARIEDCRVEQLSSSALYSSFSIAASGSQAESFTFVSPDLATCAQCLREIFDPLDRRYGYAFTNCTGCGPRYSITYRVPYDRANTVMSQFEMCANCAAEYAHPASRRFHAEPNACAVCGPQLSLSIQEIIAALAGQQIVALKGLGGFQLACDALSATAVGTLRDRKRRSGKPFAVMMRDIRTVESHCFVNDGERELLTNTSAPVVLLRMRSPQMLPTEIAPGLNEIGVMLPYTPLHHLLFGRSRSCLVMTSGNVSEEPIVISNDEAFKKLSALADRVVVHNRDIFMRVDDSVVRYAEGAPRVLRRARGFAPDPIDLGFDASEVLASGGELKNTFCLTKGGYAIVSQHIGDVENYETFQFFEETLRNLKSVYRAEPLLIAHDLHPDYLTTRWAARQPGPKLAVQHHHAHIASCMAENGVRDRVIGVAFDGTGYGTDGQIWGGEILVCDSHGFERAVHLRYVTLIGGDRAVLETNRMAASHLFDVFGPDYRKYIDVPIVFGQLLAKPQLRTSSCGRLFDAVAALAGVCAVNSYEGEAAMRLEAAAQDVDGEYPFSLDTDQRPWTIDTRPLIREIVRDIARGERVGSISGRFHRTIAAVIEEACCRVRDETGIAKICLSGGTFQNTTLLRGVLVRLRHRSFEIFTHSQVPPNDAGLSLGQAAIAAANLARVKGD